mmetsp:Transcript_1716/g.3275  ORF Transcript_1716/g.3275 Transcript_1716/m.3275 type:complete len:665 (-) Transcript_1716:310-2304(-)|eukprot:CAMPEP_0171330752 /NCGR_PEP_ID=MMETSP0878-20121228/2220_1 /TAXON_ID=67004 /ORGANISM="Thalassiosira weissflogii, Strain CCMP1336" /LENGTH=664 /DNA_ID=CAMNT_0011831125 /DNA_START=285 /DNA_END=2279 /DNA_ORIENTATION=+
MADSESRRSRGKKGKKKSRRSRREEINDEISAFPPIPIPVQDEEAYVEDVVAPVAAPTEGDLYDEGIPAPIAGPDADVSSAPAGFTEDGLAVALAVDTAAEDDYVYAAIEYDPDSKPPLHKNRRFRVYTCIALVIIVAVVVVVAVYVTKSSKGDDVTQLYVNYTDRPTRAPTPSPTTNREASGIKEQIEAGVLQRKVTFDELNATDPRVLALDWILHKDQMQLLSDDVNLYQRYVLALLAYALDSLAWFACGDHRIIGNVTEFYAVEDCEVTNQMTGQMEQFRVWLSSTDECEWYGVLCSGDGVVRGLELIGNDLIGEIPPEISQLRFLQYLAMNGNCLYGTIPPEFGSMPNLLSLELHGNGLSGFIPDELYDATKLQLLNVAMQYNYFYQCYRSNGQPVNTGFARGDVNGDLNWGLQGKVLSPQVNRWQSMKGLHLFDNFFSGDLAPELGDLKYLVFLRAQNNVFSGFIPNEITKLDKLREVHLYQNNVYGDLPPDIGLMEDLEDLRVHENEMWGLIPMTFYNLQKMKSIWFQDTLLCEQIDESFECDPDPDVGFEGSISTEIGNMKKLSQILLNNNPFTGTLPTEVGLLENLSVLHIHQTQIQGTVPDEVCLLRDQSLNSETNQGIFYADCRPNNKTGDPYFECKCCSDCCDHTTKVCIADD